ncbi:MAG TPA: 6,7-dimethyl-8-ribityllumazine synthase [Candidatus Krumholzibacteria bacterium]|jgi:6,7-dimethyl-8-ribityllumazine synthase
MSRVFEGRFDGDGARYGIVVSRFNGLFSEKLLEGCRDALRRHGVTDDDIDVAWVPGAIEIPLVCQRLAESNKYEVVIALGCVVRGATPHFDHVAQAAARGCSQVALESGVPVIFGVLTTDTLDQAMERSGTKAGNKGFEAGLNALEMANLMRQLPAEDGE